MNVLLDTHIFLWAISNKDLKRLDPQMQEILENRKNTIYVSAATIWEIEIKRKLGKLKAPENMIKIIHEKSFSALPIKVEHSEIAEKIDWEHRDPFDRILIAQAKFEQLLFLTKDQKILTSFPSETKMV